MKEIAYLSLAVDANEAARSGVRHRDENRLSRHAAREQKRAGTDMPDVEEAELGDHVDQVVALGRLKRDREVGRGLGRPHDVDGLAREARAGLADLQDQELREAIRGAPKPLSAAMAYL